MYARELMIWLHERLAERGTFDETQKRFESLRGYGLIPRGRENAAVRISNEQIAHAVLAFAHPVSGNAGHASLILGKLRVVGGVNASYKCAETLIDTIAMFIDSENDASDISRLTLSVEHDFSSDEYAALLHFKVKDEMKAVSFVPECAVSLLQPDSEKNYDHYSLQKLTSVQRSLGRSFFQSLSRTILISRQMNRPLKTDWREYETEEEKNAFHRRLGARSSSRFLNLRVDAQVTWPKEPTRMEFGGHHLVLFPKTKEHSHSISIDLARERISADTARTLMNRMLSIMSWCDDQPASLHEGWPGSPVPSPVLKRNLAFVTMQEWLFFRTLPSDENLARCLAYYRDGLNAYSVGLASHAVLSFFRVFETRYDTKPPVISWVNEVYSYVQPFISENELCRFEIDRSAENVDVGTYIYRNCRVATAHAARDAPSDPDGAEEFRRLLNASTIIKQLARFFIKQEFKFSTSYLTDNLAGDK